MDAEAESGLPVKERGAAAPTIIAPASLPTTPLETTTTTTTASPIDVPSAPASTSATSTATDRCVICLDVVTEPCVAQPCGHRHFDFLCLISWLLQRNPSCPLCKAIVETVKYGDELSKSFPVLKKTEGDVKTDSEPLSINNPPSSTSQQSSIPSRPRPRHRAPSPHSSSSSSSPSPEAALERRRSVYRLGLYARHVGANRHSRYYRELTPQLFTQDPDLVSRARAFLRRELQVFWEGDQTLPQGHSGSRPGGRAARRTNNVEFLLEYIVAILQSIDLQDSAGQAEELLQGFFRGRRDHTRHFLHELRSFLRSPYLTLASWDRNVQYGPPTRYPGADDEETVEGTATVGEVKQAPRPIMRGDYWRPSRRHQGRGTRTSGTSSGASRLRLAEAYRRYGPS
ncbi:hypothetical protein Sste5346_003074 [Sporothrix stenoceras]|uniref:RING-type E3 ubiquitin transferase n=1 Tax=Sporothrix stenoceras TaxID=5173 RepID=A0ABR3ZFR8_9PEZI